MNLPPSSTTTASHLQNRNLSAVPAHSSVRVTCDLRPKTFKNVRGLNIHKSRKHRHRRNSSSHQSSQVNNNPDPDYDLLAELQSLRKSSRIVARIPHSVRQAVAAELTSVLIGVSNSNSSAAWSRLLTFAHRVLNMNSDCPPNSSLTSKLRQNLQSWRSRSIVVPPSSFAASSSPSVSIQHYASDEDRVESWSSKCVMKKVAEGDIKGAIRILSSSDSLSDFSLNTRDTLQLKHPPKSAVFTPSREMTSQPLSVNTDQVAEALSRFGPGSAAGPDGIRPQHLKELTSKALGETGTSLLTAVTAVVNIILSGQVPDDIAPIVFGANLIALNKKGGGIRPIAIGGIFRRIAAKLACASVKWLNEILEPHQVGFGTRGGAEAVTRATRIFIESGVQGFLIKLDFTNAFNTVIRSYMLKIAEEQLPHLFPHILQAYGSSSHLLFGEHVISSAEGLQQGDPLAPVLFCLTTFPMVSVLKAPLNLWYHDDGSVGGNCDTVISDLDKVIAATPEIGLSLNPGKCELIILGQPDQAAIDAVRLRLPGIKILSPPEYTLLGAPLSDEALPKVLTDKIHQVQLLTSRLPSLQAHTALFLLKNCLSIPKIMYLLRSVPTWKSPELLIEFDNTTRVALETITNNRLTDQAWAQACLPVARGGLGIRSTLHLSVPAYLASIESTSSLVAAMLEDVCPPEVSDRPTALELWSSLSNGAQHPLSSIQKDWDLPVIDVLANLVLESAETPQDRARILGSVLESGAWLHSLPSPQLGLFLDDNTVRIAIGLRLGTQLCQLHTCRCGSTVDEQGTHGLSCQKSAARFSRHAAINEILRKALASAQVPSIPEPVGLFRKDGKRPDGLTLIPWSRGKCLLWDATIIDTLAKSYLHLTSVQAGSAAAFGENKKRDKYHEVSDTFIFCPFALETLGPFGNEARCLVKDLGRRLFMATGEPRSKSFLVQRISIAIQRGNAASVIATVPTSSKLHELYLLN